MGHINCSEYSIKQIERLDTKQEPLRIQADGIQRTSAIGQPPPVLEVVWNKILSLMEKKAKIWNDDIRGKIIPNSHETFWQAGIRTELDVKRFGKENILLFGAKEIKALMNNSQNKER